MGKNASIRWFWLLLLVGIACIAGVVGRQRLRINADVSAMVPEGHVAFASARRLTARHPSLDSIAIDIHGERSDAIETSRLLDAADTVVTSLMRTELFRSVGTSDSARGMTALHEKFPMRCLLFTYDVLAREVPSRMSESADQQRFEDAAAELAELTGTGMPRLKSDPLGLSEFVFARLGELVPTSTD
jgi:predicted exporter